MTTASAPHKVILFGEHAVVHGKLGIAAAVDKRLRVSVEPGPDGVALSDNLGLLKFNLTKMDIERACEKFRQLYAEKNFVEIKKMKFTDAIAIVLDEIFTKYGFADLTIRLERPTLLKGIGGSAAIFSALAAAVTAFLGQSCPKEELNRIAYLGEIVAHGGTPSGIDNSTVVYGGCITYRKSEGPRPLDISFSAPIIIVDSGVPANTGVTVPYVREQLERNPAFVNRVLERLNEISETGLKEIKNQNMERIGALMTDYYNELRKLDISTPELDKIVALALANGALGAKPTGGWGGGVCLVLVENMKAAQRLVATFSKNRFVSVIAKLGGPGVRVEG